MPLARPITMSLLPSPWPGLVLIIRPVGFGFLLRLTD
jgi:hypothetical protein